MNTNCGICEAEITGTRKYCGKDCANIASLISQKKDYQESKRLKKAEEAMPAPKKIVMEAPVYGDTPRRAHLDLVRKCNRRGFKRVYVGARG